MQQVLTLDLTVVDPGGRPPTRVDVTVRAAAGTPVGAVRADLLAAVGAAAGDLWVADAVVGDDAALGAPPLLHGAVLTVGAPARSHPSGLLELRVVAGPDSGAVHRLGPGEHVVGRGPGVTVGVDDPELSRRHAVLTVAEATGTTVRDLGSTNGTRVDGTPVGPAGAPLRPGAVLAVGASRLELAVPETVPVSCRPDGAGHLAVNRPPRHPAVRATVRLTRPPPPVRREHRRLPVAAVLVPLVVGAALCVVLRSPAYLAFVLLSPLMVLGSHVSDRWGGRRADREAREQHAAAAERFATDVAAACAAETAARHAEHPGAAELLLCAQGPRPRLWERRTGDPDDLCLRVGLGAVRSSIEVAAPGAGLTSGDLERPVLDAVPVVVDLRAAGVLGVAGPRAPALALTRSLTGQVAGWHSPRRVSLTLLVADPARLAAWEWVRWLPHLRRPDGGLSVAAGPAAARSLVDALLAELDARRAGDTYRDRAVWDGPVTVVVLDGAHRLRAVPGVSRLLERGPRVGLLAVCLEEQRVSLPAECRAVADIGDDHRVRAVGGEGTTYDDVLLDGVGPAWAARFARALAPLRDATPEGEERALPATARWLDLRDDDVTDAGRLAAAWTARPRGCAVALGVGTDGHPAVVDLARDGPHVLVAGTTGAGKSELLQTLVAALAVANRPDELTFVLVDYKGAAAFRDCARLPHCAGLVTDLDGHLTARALTSLTAELRRRERLLSAAGCTDIEQYAARAPDDGPRLARLVLVVDELATLVEELPDFVGGLVGLAQRGRSLGLHLVLATQRPAGVVSADIRANTGLRIALRVTDPAESVDVVDVATAAHLPRDRPGRAVVRLGSGVVSTVQTARVTGQPPAAPRPLVVVRPWPAAADPLPVTRSGPPEPGEQASDLDRIVRATTAAADRVGARPPPPPWLPPLPDVVTASSVTARLPPGTAVALGLVDRPGAQRQDALLFDPARPEHLLVAGGPRSGRTTVLRTLAAALAGRFAVDDLHLHVLDGGGQLAGLGALPHCGTVAGRDDPVLADRLLALLTEEMLRRRPASDRPPWLVLLVDGWESLTEALEQVDHGRPVDALLRLVRDGAPAGVRVVLAGDRAVLAGRVAAGFRDRLVLPMADPADYALAGLPARSVPGHRPPGRAVVGGSASTPERADVAQLAVLGDDPAPAAQDAQVAALAGAAVGQVAPRHSRCGPLRLRPLPAVVGLAELSAAAAARSPSPGWVLVGAGGDDAGPVGVDLDGDGPALVVAGPPGSGRSTLLLGMADWLLARGRPVLVVAGPRSPLRSTSGRPGLPRLLALLGPFTGEDAAGLQDCLSHHPDAVVLVDDAEELHESPVEDVLRGALRGETPGRHGAPVPMALAGDAAELAVRFRGLTVEARRTRTGVLLCPSSAVDGDLLGVRVPTGAPRLPGRGLLVTRGRAIPVQVARPDR